MFIDKVELLLPKRDMVEKTYIDHVMTTYFEELASTSQLLGATSYPWLVDPEALRFFMRFIYVGMPDVEARRQILERQFKGVPCREPLDFDRFTVSRATIEKYREWEVYFSAKRLCPCQ